MTKEQAKKKIFTLLYEEYQRPGSDGRVDRDKIFKELAIRETAFNAALMELRGNSDLIVEFATPGKIRFGVSGREQCEVWKNTLRKKYSSKATQ
jgi:hypothetical protein